MTEAIFYPAANSDNGCSRTLGDFHNEWAWFGKSGGQTFSAFFRFTGVTIPQGSTITLAVLQMVAGSGVDLDQTMSVIISANDVDDAVAPTNKSENDALVITDATVPWIVYPVEFLPPAAYDTPGLASVIQEVVDREGWASGNALMIVSRDNGSDSSGGFDAWTYQDGETYSIPELHVEWTEPEGASVDIPVAEVEVTAHAPRQYTNVVDIPLAEIELLARAPAAIWALPASAIGTAQTIFRCYLTGADDGLDDLELPISSWQATVRDGDPTYLSAVVPDTVTYTAGILARTNGDVVIKKGVLLPDGTEQLEEIVRVHYESIQIFRGARNESLTISGHRTTSSSAPKEWTVEGVSYYGLYADGKRTIRAKFDLFLRVGDICIYGTGGNDYFTVGEILYWVVAKPPTLFMQVTEA